MKWHEKFEVSSHDVDYMGIAKASSTIRFMQEAANKQLEAMGPTTKEMTDAGKAFMLFRVAASFYTPLFAHDNVEVVTWAGKSDKGIILPRCSQVRKNGVIVAELISTWAVIDINTRKIVRLGNELDKISIDETIQLDMPSRFKIPDDVSLALTGEYTISYGVCDINRHMNNTYYPDMLCDFIPGGMDNKRIIGLAISYNNEAILGDTVKVYVGHDEYDGKYYFRTIRGDGKIGIEAEITTDDLNY